MTAACAESGAQVWITDYDPHRRQLVGRFGATTDFGGKVDGGIDFNGSAAAVAAGLARLDVGGVLVLAGSVLPGPALSVDPETVVRQWLTITGVHNYEPRHLIRAVEFLDRTADTYPWADVVGDPVGIDALATVVAPAPVGKLRASVALGSAALSTAR